MTSDEMPECPLCMVELFYDDLGFYPCSCGYQICRFCWSKILNEENGLCPACRRAYDSEAPASFTPLSEEQFQKLKREKRQKERKNKTIENRKHLADIRVVQKNLAFIIGLPQRFADHPEHLKSQEYFGKYGKVFKVVVNRNVAQPNSQNQSTVGAYVTFVKGEGAIQAILDLNKQQMDGRTLKASLGTTKYCSQFLKGASCTKGECMYLHELGEQAASFTKEEMQQNKHTEYERKLIDDFIEQLGMSTESSVNSSSQSHQTSSQSSSQNQNQSHNRLQHPSECRDQSSSSSNSNSNTPPSSRRQTKSESHTQAHRHSQQSHHSKHTSSHRSGATTNSASSSGDTNLSTQSSQRTPRKNSQNHKSHHNQGSHGRGHQQKQQKQRSTQQQKQPPQEQQSLQQQSSQPTQRPQQLSVEQQNPSSQSRQPLQPHPGPVMPSLQTQTQTCQPSELQNQEQETSPTQPHLPASSASLMTSDTPSVDPVTDIMPQDAPNSNSFPISTGLSLPPSLMGFDHQTPLHSLPGSGPSLTDDDQSASNATVSSASISTVNETPTAPQSTPSLLPASHQMRAETLNGLNSSAVGMSPYPLPSVCSFTFQQFMMDFHRQQLQQQQQSLLNSFDSQQPPLPTTSYSSDHQTSQPELASSHSEENRHYQLPPLSSLASNHTSSKWPVTDASSLVQDPAPVIESLTDTFSAQDDVANLDFDPVKESQQALAALLEHERNNCAVGNVTAANTGYLSSNCTQSQLTPPPGFEMPPFSSGARPAALRPPNMNLCHPGMMGFGYYSGGVPSGTVDMGLPNEACISRPDKASVNLGMTPGADRPRHLPSTNSTTGHSTAPGPASPGLPFSVKALQDTLRCVLPEETNITFDPSLMREMQFQQFEPCAANAPVAQSSAGSASQIPSDAITSANNSRGVNQSFDTIANSSAKGKTVFFS